MLPGHWRWAEFETTRWFVGPDGRTQATLYRLIRDEPARISSSRCSMTAASCARRPGPAHAVAAELPGDRDPRRGGEPLLAAHEEQVSAFARDRGVNARAATVAEVTAASDAAERPLMRQIGYVLYAMLLPLAPAVLFFAVVCDRNDGVAGGAAGDLRCCRGLRLQALDGHRPDAARGDAAFARRRCLPRGSRETAHRQPDRRRPGPRRSPPTGRLRRCERTAARCGR